MVKSANDWHHQYTVRCIATIFPSRIVVAAAVEMKSVVKSAIK
jgi:hypothetical protein